MWVEIVDTYEVVWRGLAGAGEGLDREWPGGVGAGWIWPAD